MSVRHPFRRRRPNPDPAHRTTVLIANPGADLYGSDRMALETVAALVGAGHRVVLTVPGPGPLIELARQAGGEVVTTRTPIIRKSALRPVGMIGLIIDTARAIVPGVKLIRAIRPDVVLVNTITPPLWFGLARLLRTPVACHVHEAEASLPRLIRIALAAPLLLTVRLIANSEFCLNVATDAVPALRRRSVVVYNAVTGPALVHGARAEFDLPIRLIYVGRLSARKGVLTAVEAVGLLRDRGVEVNLMLVGAVFPGYEWFQSELEQTIARLELTARVTFAGYQEDRWPLTEQADIVLIPSIADESFGNVVVEAGLAARPQIVSDMSGLREAASGIRSAVQIPPSDPEAIADAVQRIALDWGHFRSAAMTDSTDLADRYSHRRYAEQLAAIIAAIAPAQVSGSGLTGCVDRSRPKADTGDELC